MSKIRTKIKTKPLISIIVPVYNVEKYLKQCVDSILNQTLKELEILLIDDGSTDNCPKICDDYAKSDRRVKVIHKANGGLGAAYNTGIAATAGEYIGFVESDDWIEPDMYEQLYAKAKEYDVDIVKSLYTNCFSETNRRVVNKFSKCKYCNQPVTDNLKIPEFYWGHVSHWSAIYRNSLIKDNHIILSETPGASCQDVGFAFQCFVFMKSCYLMTKSFYNYRLDNADASNKKGYKIAMASFKERQHIRDLIENKKLDKEYREIEAKKVFEALYNDYTLRCSWSQKFTFIRLSSLLFRKYLKEIDCLYFNKNEVRTFKQMARFPVYFYLKNELLKTIKNPNEHTIRFCGFTIFSKKKSYAKKSLKILGITFKKKKTSPEKTVKTFMGVPYFRKKIKNGITKFYILGLPIKKVKTLGNVVKKYFLGICYKKSQLPLNQQFEKKLMYAHVVQIVGNMLACSRLHSQTFPKYKNINKGKDIVIVATGPTVKFAPKFPDALHIACNRSVELEQFHYDYCFMIDYPNVRPYIDKTFDRDFINFFGQYMNECVKKLSIPDYIAERANAERFFTDGPYAVDMYHDIETHPLADFWSIVHPAIHFALYTHPKRIYLLGCDTANNGYIYKNQVQKQMNLQKLLYGFRKIKQFADFYYPDVEIISVNPVGLKGLYKDVYTDTYLAEHPEINAKELTVIKGGED